MMSRSRCRISSRWGAATWLDVGISHGRRDLIFSRHRAMARPMTKNTATTGNIIDVEIANMRRGIMKLARRAQAISECALDEDAACAWRTIAGRLATIVYERLPEVDRQLDA